MKTFKILLIFTGLLLNCCTSKSVIKVNSDAKTKFGLEISAPNAAVFFVENNDSKIGVDKADQHKKIADRMHNKYGPARDNFFIGRTNAKDFKFNLKNEHYYIELQNISQRTAMILFDGKHKPFISYDPEKYDDLIKNKIINK